MISIKLKKLINIILQKLNYRVVSIYGSTLIDKHEISKHNLIDLLPLILNVLASNLEQIRFVQVGANDGITGDNFRNYIEKYSLTGIMVEPQKKAFDKLDSLYAECSNIACENIAISAIEKSTKFYFFDRDYEKEMPLDVFSSINEKHLISWKKRLKLEANIISKVISTTTIDRLLNKHGMDNMEILVIDTEGYDFEIIKSVNYNRLHPYLIQYEHAFLAAKEQLDAVGFLIDKDYKIISYEKDTIAVHKSIFSLI